MYTLLDQTQLTEQYNTFFKNIKQTIHVSKTPLYLYHSPIPPYWYPPQPTTAEIDTDIPVVFSMDMAGQLDIFRHYS